MRRGPVGGVVAGVVLVVAAAAVSLTAPSSDEQAAAFPVQAAVGERAVGRSVALTVQQVELARTVRSGAWTGTTPGVWVVVRVRSEQLLASGRLLGTLEAGGRTWDASDRPPDALNSAVSDPGLPVDGALLFEVPRGTARMTAVLRITTGSGPQLDSEIVVPVDLRRLDVGSTLAVDATGAVTP